MVKAGAGTDAVIDALVDVFEPGDIIVDGGNALFTDTIRREKAVRETGINFVGAGISGGEEGALLGPSIMPGGSDESWVTLGPILKSIAAIAEGEPCVTHVGHDGAGHFVKMVHNGIEYADMQLIAEAYDLIRRGTGKTPAEIADVFAEWNRGELESYLIEITAEVLRQVDAETGKPLVDVILDQAGAKGTGAWTVQTALEPGRARLGHRRGGLRPLAVEPPRAARGLARPARRRGGRSTVDDADAFIEDVRLALYASKIVAYSQGFDEIRAGAAEYDWTIDLGAVVEDLARRLHHPRPVPQPHRRRLRRDPRPAGAAHRAVLRRGARPRAGRVAPDRRRRPRPPASPPPRSRPRCRTTTACAPTGSPPRWCRDSATSSAPTPTSASTSPAPSTRCGRATAPRSRPKTRTDARRSAPASVRPDVVVAAEEVLRIPLPLDRGEARHRRGRVHPRRPARGSVDGVKLP